jgi:hypothetical protein
MSLDWFLLGQVALALLLLAGFGGAFYVFYLLAVDIRTTTRNAAPLPTRRAGDQEHYIALFCAARGLSAQQADLIWLMAQAEPPSASAGDFIRSIDGHIATLTGLAGAR